MYANSRQFAEVVSLLKSSNSLFSSIAKSRTAKIVRNILDIVAEVPDSIDIQVELCKDVIEWCKAEKRTFLRQRVEAKVFYLCFGAGEAFADESLFVVGSAIMAEKGTLCCFSPCE